VGQDRAALARGAEPPVSQALLEMFLEPTHRRRPWIIETRSQLQDSPISGMLQRVQPLEMVL
jgi:hypothetical protein